jgi:hypothetical protein
MDPSAVKAKAKKDSDVPPNAFRHMAKQWYNHRKKSISANYIDDQWGGSNAWSSRESAMSP